MLQKKGTFSTATRSDLKVKNVPFTITISEMLHNVKDSHNQPFINKDGTLSQGINFYANNDSNYHQTVEELTGKKDLIAYHNISQDNLDTDFSNFGNITLLMPQDVVNSKETPVYTRDAWTWVFPVCLCRKKFRGLLWITETCILLYFIKMSYNISKHRATLDVSNVFNRAKYVYFR